MQVTSEPHGGLLQLDPQTCAFKQLTATGDVYRYISAAYDNQSQCHFFSDGEALARSVTT